MIKFDKTTCMVIVSTDKIKYETRVSDIIAFASYRQYGKYPKSHKLAHFLNKAALFYIEKCTCMLYLSWNVRFWYITHMRKVVFNHEWTGTLICKISLFGHTPLFTPIFCDVCKIVMNWPTFKQNSHVLY